MMRSPEGRRGGHGHLDATCQARHGDAVDEAEVDDMLMPTSGSMTRAQGVADRFSEGGRERWTWEARPGRRAIVTPPPPPDEIAAPARAGRRRAW